MSSRLGSLLADRFSESIASYSKGLRIIDRKVLIEYLTEEWTTLEDLRSNEICLRIGRKLGATVVVLGTLTEAKEFINLIVSFEGFGFEAKRNDLLPWRGAAASFALTDEMHQMLLQPGPNYAPNTGEIPEEAGVVRLGRDGSPGVTAPKCIACLSAEYSDAARAAKYQGTVELSILVGVDGQVTSIYVLKGAPFGLTARAIEAMRGWRLEPAQKDGKPVAVRVDSDMTFRFF